MIQQQVCTGSLDPVNCVPHTALDIIITNQGRVDFTAGSDAILIFRATKEPCPGVL